MHTLTPAFQFNNSPQQEKKISKVGTILFLYVGADLCTYLGSMKLYGPQKLCECDTVKSTFLKDVFH